MKIFLLRHAKSVNNDANVWTGRIDADLSEQGIAEQNELCARFEYPRADAYFSSPLLRCTRSFKLIYGDTPYRKVPELTECALGCLEGKPYTNLNDDPFYLKWLREPENPFHGGESFSEFTLRSRSGFIKTVADCEAKKVSSAVIMTHGNVMRAVLCGFVDPEIPHDKWSIPNGGGYLFEFTSLSEPPVEFKCLPEFLFDIGN